MYVMPWPKSIPNSSKIISTIFFCENSLEVAETTNGEQNRLLCSNVSQTILNMFFISVLSASSDCAIESSACFDEQRAATGGGGEMVLAKFRLVTC